MSQRHPVDPSSSTEDLRAVESPRRRARQAAEAHRESKDGRVDGPRRHTAPPPIEIDIPITSRAHQRGGRHPGRRGRVPRWARVLAATTVVSGLTFLLAPAAGNLSFGDRLLTIDDTNPLTPTVTPEDPSPEPSGPSPSVTPTPTPDASSSAPSDSSSATSTSTTSPSPRRRVPRATRSAPASGPTGNGGVAVGGAVAGGWYAGASGIGVTDGSFEKWAGSRVTIAAMWADTSSDVQETLPSLTSEYANWNGAIDIAVGGTVLGSSENYAAAASGAYDERWKAAAKVLADNRRGKKAPTFVRPFHEMNGDWYDEWMVTKSNSADFKKAFARYVGILRAAMPEVYISWSPNWGDHTGLPVSYWYPGDSVVDCVAPDYYDDGSSDARLSVAAWNAEANDVDSNGNPAAPESWRRWALSHGKPLCFPEWGLKPEGAGVDHPEWIKAVNLWMNQHANTATWRVGQPIPRSAAGKVLYSCYFNVVHGGNAGFTIFGEGANPKSAAVFDDLKWGNHK